MTVRRITVQLTGQDDDHGDVRFNEFIKQLDAIRHALSEVERVVARPRSVYFRIAELHHDSPTTVVLEAVDRTKQAHFAVSVVEKFYQGVEWIQNRAEAPPELDYEALRAFQAMAARLGGSIVGMTIARNGDFVPLTQSFKANIDKILGPSEEEYGVVTGRLEQINLHAGKNSFTIYPTSDLPRVRCVFPQELREEAVQAVDKYVTVYGIVAYFETSIFPHQVRVRRIDIHEPSDSLPNLDKLRGIAPDATGERSSEEFVRTLRDDW